MFGENIKKLRISIGLNQVEFAKKLGISKQSVSNWENENIQPSIDMLLKTAKTFSVSCDYLLGNERARTLDVSGLSERQISILQEIADDIRKAKNNG